MSTPTPSEHAAFQAYLAGRGQDADELAPLDYAEALGDWRTQERFAALEAEVERLREALRWRTVAADGLPEAGVRVLVQTMTAPLEIVTRQRVDFWDDGVLHDAWQISSGERYGTDPADRWLPVPEETP